MEIKHLNELCSSHLVETLERRFNKETQRSISMSSERNKAIRKAIVAIIAIIAFALFPLTGGNPWLLVARILLGVFGFIQVLGIISFIGKYSSFGKNRTLDNIQAFYSSIFLQTTDKYRTTPRDRNRSLKRAYQDNIELFPYPMVNYFTKDGYKKYLYEWNEVLRSHPLWKIEICALRLMFIKAAVGKCRFIRVEIDYRVEEKLETFVLYNAIIELQGVFYLVSPYPYSDE